MLAHDHGSAPGRMDIAKGHFLEPQYFLQRGGHGSDRDFADDTVVDDVAVEPNSIGMTTAINTADPFSRRTVSVGARPGGAVYSPDDATAYVTNGDDISVTMLTNDAQPCVGITCFPTGFVSE
ncbi:hypothetical protein ACIGGF_02225 [Rhodococcus sp. NPDC078407]|uniref:hypothetical protein n=1 Tax=Rhodococcus sp. NPDC078407 TaxID=3364509 RepID=UPI0037CAFD29